MSTQPSRLICQLFWSLCLATICALPVAHATPAAQSAPTVDASPAPSEPDTPRMARLDVALTADATWVPSGQSLKVTITVRNDDPREWRPVPAAWLNSDGLDQSFWRVTLEDEALPYEGPRVKRSPEDAWITLAPGEIRLATHTLDRIFDLRAGGHYRIAIDGVDADHAIAVHLVDDPLRRPQANTFDKGVTEGSVAYARNCSTAQRSRLGDALRVATGLAQGAATALALPMATVRYTTWFGAWRQNRYMTVRRNFEAIAEALQERPLRFDCGCTDPTTFAYVIAKAAYRIHLCGKFWSASLAGTDSAGGTLIHEVSHFNAVAGTDDLAYGTVLAQDLARRNPTKAVRNADSYEYFAENVPHLP